MHFFKNPSFKNFTLIPLFFLYASSLDSQESKIPPVRGPEMQIKPPAGYNFDLGPEKTIDSFRTDAPDSILLGTINLPKESTYKIKGTNILIPYTKKGTVLKNKILKTPILKNFMTNNLLEFLPTDNRFPSAQLKIKTTPQINIVFDLIDKGYSTILNIPKFIQFLEKNLKALKTDRWKPNSYIFINGHPITITLNISIETNNIYIDSIEIGYFLTTSRSTPKRKILFKKFTTKTFSNKELSDQKIIETKK